MLRHIQRSGAKDCEKASGTDALLETLILHRLDNLL